MARDTRNTQQRDAICKVFEEHEAPLRVEDVLAYAREGVPQINQATVYRNIKRLVADNWLVRVEFPPLGTLYERAGKAHHHHFYCRKCDKLIELPGCALKVNDCVPTGFDVECHEVFLQGRCSDCSDD